MTLNVRSVISRGVGFGAYARARQGWFSSEVVVPLPPEPELQEGLGRDTIIQAQVLDSPKLVLRFPEIDFSEDPGGTSLQIETLSGPTVTGTRVPPAEAASGPSIKATVKSGPMFRLTAERQEDEAPGTRGAIVKRGPRGVARAPEPAAAKSSGTAVVASPSPSPKVVGEGSPQEEEGPDTSPKATTKKGPKVIIRKG